MTWWRTESLTPFEPRSSICVVGPTGVGKTHWIVRLLKNLDGMYVKDPPKKILYCYGSFQPLFNDLERDIPSFTLHQGLPNRSEIDEFADGQQGLIVLDDLMHIVVENPEMELLFTRGCHHQNISVIFVVQNLYSRGKSARTIALNTGYLVLFKNVRDVTQIATLGRQIFPRKSGILVEAYRDATKRPFGYLIVDSVPYAEDEYRLRTNVFVGEDPVIYSICD